ncbi:MAG TPA: hypothetical protein VGD56_19645 [Gemmatirosa sp.]
MRRDAAERWTAQRKGRDLFVVAALTPVWWLVARVSSVEKGFLAWCVAMGFYVVASELWGYRRTARFWAALSALALLHVVALWAVSIPERLGKSAIDVAVADGLLVWLVLRGLMRGVRPDA